MSPLCGRGGVHPHALSSGCMSPLCGQGGVHPRALPSGFAARSTAARPELAELAEFQLSRLLTVPGGVSALSWESGRRRGTERRCETEAHGCS